MKLKINYIYLTDKVTEIDITKKELTSKLSLRIDLLNKLLKNLHFATLDLNEDLLTCSLIGYNDERTQELCKLIDYSKKIEKDNSQFKSSIAAKQYSLVISLIAKVITDIIYVVNYHLQNCSYNISKRETKVLIALKKTVSKLSLTELFL